MEPVVIIPALNPDIKLVLLVEKLQKVGLKAVVVNDGSKPECQGIFEILRADFQCDICSHDKNMGKGAALKTGFRYAAYKYPHCIGYVTADADGQHTAEDILGVAELLKTHPDKLILGKREFSHGNVPARSAWGNRITSFVYLLNTGRRCEDTQTGLRGIPSAYVDLCLSIAGDKYEYEMNMLLEMGRKEIQFKYVPIETIYIDGNAASHFHPVRDSVRIYLNIFKYSLSSLTSAIADILLFTLLVSIFFGKTTAGVLAATVIARVISGCVNFNINKKWVFKSENYYKAEVIKYMTLFCCQMTLSWLLVSSLKSLPVNITLIKIIVDTMLFFISYYIQKKYIFCNKRKEGNGFDKKFLHKTI